MSPLIVDAILRGIWKGSVAGLVFSHIYKRVR
jgi:hypothetical protein